MTLIDLAKFLHDVLNEIQANDCHTPENILKLQNLLRLEIEKMDKTPLTS